jgi:O-antigen biosynthesis protein
MAAERRAQTSRRAKHLKPTESPDPWSLTHPYAPLNVVVLGMHRSGTSAVAGALRAAGLFAGDDDDLMPPVSENPFGFSERRDVAAFNDRLLHSLGWTWDGPDPTPLKNPPSRSEFVEEGREIVDRHLAGERPWVLKDPRISLLLPWWRQILLDRFVAVVCTRPAAEVAWSLSVRNGFPIELGLALWAAYYRHLAAGLEGLPVVVVDYVSLTQQPERTMPNVLSALLDRGVPGNLDGGAAQASIAPALRRPTQPGSLLRSGSLPDTIGPLQDAWAGDAVSVYQRFTMDAHDFAGWESALLRTQRRVREEERDKSQSRAAHQELRAELEGLQGALAERAAEVERVQAALAGQGTMLTERSAELERLQATLRQRATEIERWEATAAERSAELERLQATLADRNAELPRLQAMLAERDSAVGHLEAELTDRSAELERVRAMLADSRTAGDEWRSLVERHEAALAERDSKLDQLRATLAEQSAQIELWGSAVERLQEMLAERGREVERLDATLTDRGTELERVRATLADSRSAGDELRNLVERHEAALAERNAELDQLRATLAEQSAEIELWESAVERVQAMLVERDSAVEHLGAELTDRGTELERVQATLADSRTAGEELRSLVERHEAALAERNSELEQLQATLAEQSVEIELWGSAVERVQAMLAERDSAVEWLQATVAERDSAVEWLQATVAERDSAVEWLSGELGHVRHRADALGQALLLERRSPWRKLLAAFRRRVLTLLYVLPFGWTNPLLDVEWYLARYPDVRRQGVPPQRHYRRHGAREGRDPNALFDTDWYLATNPDVAAGGVNPLDHYLRFGAREGRDPSPGFDTDWYVAQNPDVEAAGLNPLLHYLRLGAREGRAATPLLHSSAGAPPMTADPGTGDAGSSLVPPDVAQRLSQKLDAAAAGTPNGLLLGLAKLESFLSSGHRLSFPAHRQPQASVVIPTFGQAHLTFLALEALLATAHEAPFELIIVDNASTDRTRELLSRLDNVQVVLNDVNVGFGAACVIGSEMAAAPAIAFLNSDTMVAAGWLQALLDTLGGSAQCGAVGSKLVFPNGRLQEAGGILWSDGSAWGYGRDADPSAPEFNYVREVDYCSAASLLVRREVFRAVGGFDARYAPAYYEDVDLCLSIWSDGNKVMYQPRSVVFHMEFGSSDASSAIGLQERNRQIFAAKWAPILDARERPSPDRVAAARDRRVGARVLVIDDRIPDPTFGSGFPRTEALLEALSTLGYVITYLPILDAAPLEPATTRLQERGIEVLYGVTDIRDTLRARADLYDVAVVSRPHNARFIDSIREFNRDIAVIYDAEAIFALRDALQSEVGGRPVPPAEVRSNVNAEIALAASADAVITVSDQEAAHFRESYPDTQVSVWGTSVNPREDTPGFGPRSGLLFVGNLSTPPNVDALSYFLDEAFAAVQSELKCGLIAVGADPAPGLLAAGRRHGGTVTFTGTVSDLAPLYDRARVFVAPHRFAAGIPLKVVEAMANGVPTIVSPLLAEQLGISFGAEALVASSPAEFVDATIRLHRDQREWERIRSGGLTFVRARFAVDAGQETLRACVQAAIRRVPRPDCIR